MLCSSYTPTAERNPATIKGMMEKAAKEFKVPVELLMAIGQVETNWTQIGPSIDRGWGVMHLVQNHYSDTLGEAATLLNLPAENLKNDINANIRGMAALLANRATPAMKSSKNVADWFPAAKAVTGLDGEDLRTTRATKYFEVLKTGVKSRTLFDSYVEISPIKNFKFTAPPVIEEEAGAEYPGATNDYISCNFTAGRNNKVDTWTNHWIGVGSAEGARSWFKNCSASASAHFVVTQDGRVFQLRPSTDTTWHAGAKGYPKNNHRSIGVEHEVIATHPDKWNTEALLNASAKLASHYISKYGIPKNHVSGNNDTPGIRGHQEMPGTATACPGPLPWDKWFAKLGGGSSGGGSSAPSAGQATGQFTGIVYRGSNKDDRIAGASVRIDATTVQTDKSGVYIFKGVVPGNYTIHVTANGQTKSITRTAKAGETIWGSVSF